MFTRKDRVKRSRVYMRERPWQYRPNRLFPLCVNSINGGTLEQVDSLPIVHWNTVAGTGLRSVYRRR